MLFKVLWSGQGTRGRAGGWGCVLWCQGGEQKQQLKELAHMTWGAGPGMSEACQEEELSSQLASEGKRPPSLWQVTCFTPSLLQMAVPC